MRGLKLLMVRCAMQCMLLLFFGSFSLVLGQKSYSGQSIEDILELPEEDIDLGIAVLVLAKDAFPDMDVQRFVDLLDYMTREIQYFAESQNVTLPEHRIALMNTYLFKPGWWNDNTVFTYDLDDLQAIKKTNRYLNGLLATKNGSCVTLPMLYGVLAQRLGWPVYMVSSPKHYHCRYIDDRLEEQNIDATVWGGYISNERYIQDAAIPERPLQNGVYLGTLSNKEYLASLLVDHARLYQPDAKRPAQYLEKAIELAHLTLKYRNNASSAHYNLGSYYQLFIRKIRNQWKVETYTLKTEGNQHINDRLQAGMYTMKAGQLPTGYQRDTTLNLIQQYLQAGFELDLEQIKADALLIRERINTKLDSLDHHYSRRIEEYQKRSTYHSRKADSLGIVLDFTESFYRKQAESIEKVSGDK